ncbi:MAG: hypothetical protein V7L11_19705, partial [Nostoc sp.]|uniref:hypothetical protein n=1 Tax=Nostoc sp. TaxID=1180 RepID=UPI002FF98EC9
MECIPSGAISQDKPRLKWVLHVDCRFLNPLIYDKKGSIQFWKIYHLWENVKENNPVRSLTMNQEK